MKKEATWSSEALLDFQRNTRSHIPEERTLQLEMRVAVVNFTVEICRQRNQRNSIRYSLHLSAKTSFIQLSIFLNILPTFKLLTKWLRSGDTPDLCSEGARFEYPPGHWDSSVGIATGYGLAGVQVPVGSRIFYSPRRPDRLWGPPNLLSNGYSGGKTAGAWSWPLTTS
jgi:hypothetical protein